MTCRRKADFVQGCQSLTSQVVPPTSSFHPALTWNSQPDKERVLSGACLLTVCMTSPRGCEKWKERGSDCCLFATHPITAVTMTMTSHRRQLASTSTRDSAYCK